MLPDSYADFPKALQAQLLRVIGCSPFAAGLIDRYPDKFRELVASGRLDGGPPPALESTPGTTDFDRGLRIFRNIEMLRIIWRDLTDRASLKDTLADLTQLAETCIRSAIQHHSVLLQSRHGHCIGVEDNEQQLIVIAMGKLGGGELNMSSDIDLIFVYTGEGETNGKQKLSAAEYFTRLTRAVISTLSDHGDHGFVFRVDTRLRPYGSSGPVVVSEASIEQYYQREGREWERYALIKARPVAGDINAGAALLQRLGPFMYRRYVDFGVFEELREMAAKLDEEANRRGWHDDIKRGAGGIREAEFFIQSFQLLRGGKELGLQTSSFFRAAQAVSDLGLVDTVIINRVTASYSYLRIVENRLQALHDQQTHRLPATDPDQRALAMAMQSRDWKEFCASVEHHQNTVREVFDTLARPANSSASVGEGAANWVTLSTSQESLETLAAAISTEAETAVDLLTSFRRYLGRTALSQRARQRLDRLMPQLLGRLADTPLPATPLNQVLDLVRAISKRSAYLVLLNENPLAMDRLLALFNQSSWLAEQVIRFPLLLDELIDPALTADLPTRDALEKSLARTVRSDQDDGQQLVALNEFKLGALLRIAVAELENHIDVIAAQDLLSELAEVLIERVLQMAVTALSSKHDYAADIALGVIAYGTLGARELGYQSDLDLVFLYQRQAAGNDESHAVRVSQRLLTFLSSQTTSGALYQVDTRLRPNGSSGSLVTSLDAFAAYQVKQSWTWEQQALTRARWIGGSREICTAFNEVRSKVCGSHREAAALRQEIISMRERIRSKKYDATQRRMDFKHAPGGLLDIEFITQYGVLLHAADNPVLLSNTNTLEQIRQLAGGGFLTADDAVALKQAWLLFSRGRHFAALSPTWRSDDIKPHLKIVSGLWKRLFESEQGAPAT